MLQPWKSWKRLSCDAGGKSTANLRFVEILANEDQLTDFLFPDAPEAIRLRVKHGLHALEDDTFCLALDLQDTLASVDVRAEFTNQFAQPRFDFLQIERAIIAEIK